MAGAGNKPLVSGTPAKVLVVDDEEWMRDACGQILQPEGFEVIAAPDGPSGLELARRHSPDLVLADLKMPGMDGLAYLEAVKAFAPDIVAIVITGYATLEVAVEAMKAGAYDFLAKPFKPADLRAVVRRGIEHRAAALRASALLHGKAPAAELQLAMLAHRFKAPLAALRQCLGVVLHGYAGDVTPRAKGMLELVAQRADQMMRFVSDWLTLARLEQGKGLQEVKEMPLADLVKAAVERVRQEPQAEKLTVSFTLKTDPGAVRADPSALDELFANLLDNAVRYTPAGGTVTAEVNGTETWAAVTVRDTGPGIAPEDLGHIFDTFYRGQAQKSIPGTGLGLPIVKKILDIHGGRIEVQTALGQGSAFRVLLPRVASIPSTRLARGAFSPSPLGGGPG
ncbi:MAG: response regulator [Planctomycetes bacterium]|nr:response regulator [Planctomycetota bacterium]